MKISTSQRPIEILLRCALFKLKMSIGTTFWFCLTSIHEADAFLSTHKGFHYQSKTSLKCNKCHRPQSTIFLWRKVNGCVRQYYSVNNVPKVYVFKKKRQPFSKVPFNGQFFKFHVVKKAKPFHEFSLCQVLSQVKLNTFLSGIGIKVIL